MFTWWMPMFVQHPMGQVTHSQTKPSHTYRGTSVPHWASTVGSTKVPPSWLMSGIPPGSKNPEASSTVTHSHCSQTRPSCPACHSPGCPASSGLGWPVRLAWGLHPPLLFLFFCSIPSHGSPAIWAHLLLLSASFVWIPLVFIVGTSGFHS